MATFSELLSKSQKSLGKTTSQSGASRRSNFYSDRDGFDRLVQRSQEELNRPKISHNAGQQQFLNTLTDEEKYEYFKQTDPVRAESHLNNMETRAQNWINMSQKTIDAAAPINNQYLRDGESADDSKSPSEEKAQQQAVKNAEQNLAQAKNALSKVNKLRELNRVVEQNRDLQPWERELNILTSNLSDDYKINSIAAYDPREAARLANMTEAERAEEFRWLPKYGRMNLDQYEKALADAESAFYNYYTTEYNPNDPASVKRYEDLNAEHEWLLNHKDSAWMRSNRQKYEGIAAETDFEKNSATDYTNRDPMYMYINNIGGVQDKEESKDVYLRYGEGAASSGNPSTKLYEKYKGMTDEEVAMYNYLYKTKGKEAADEYLTFAEYAINARNLEQTREEATDAANKNLVGASLDSVGKSTISGIGFLDAAVQKAGQVTSELFGGGIAAPVDYNTAAMQPSVYASTVLQVGAENLNKKYGMISSNEEDRGKPGVFFIDEKQNPLMARIFNGKGWGDVYQMGMSQLNSWAGAGLSFLVPSLGLITLASSAATNEMLNTVEKGGSDTQALAMGFFAGFAEYIMEKFPMDNLLHGDWTGNKLGSLIRQTLPEGFEEGGTSIINWAADAIIMARDSDYSQKADAYIANGMDEKTAKWRAFWDKVIEIGWDVAGGIAMGSMTGAVRAGTQTIIDTKNIGTLKKSASIDTYRAITPDLVTRVLAETPNDKTALSIRTQMNEGGVESVKANDIYRLILKNGDTVNQMLSSAAQVINESAAIVEKAEAMPVSVTRSAIDQVKAGTATNKTFEKILDAAKTDPAIQAELKSLGVDITAAGGMTTAQKRAAVKTAIEGVAKQETESAAKAAAEAQTRAVAAEEVVQTQAEPSVANANPTDAAEAAPTESVYSQSTQIAIDAQRSGDNSRVGAFISKAINSPSIMAELGVQRTGNNQKDRTAIKKRIAELAAMPATSAPTTTATATTAKAAPARAVSSSSTPALESYAQFADNYRQATPNATDAQIRAAYELKATSIAREGQKIFVDGKELSYDGYRSGLLALARARGWTITEQQIKDAFDTQRKEQSELKDAADKVNKTFAKAGFGITARISYSADDFPKVKGLQGNAFFDHSKNEIVFNGNVVTVDDVVHRRLGHEIFHPSVGQKADMTLVNATIDVFAELNAAGKLVGEAKRLATNMDAEIKNRVDLYKRVHGDGFTESDARVELAADLFGELFHETSLSEDIAGVKPSLASKWHKAIQKIRKKFGFADDSDDIVATKIRDLESKLIEALKKRGENPDGIVNHSISSTAEAAGIQAVRDEKSGRITFLDDGVPIDEVTAEHIRDRSALGVLIKTALENKFIASADAKIQFEAAAEIMNMITTTQDPDMVWQFVGASMFSAVKSNADGQYGTTVDFSTICRKTQDMITAMSHAMKKLGRGLTKDEVTQLQKKLIEEGTPVPCPVCYVFSRWAGIGAVLDKMALWQDKYADYDKQALADRIAELEKRSKAADLRKALKAEDDEYQKLNGEHEKLSRKLTGLRKQLKAAKGEDADSVKAQIDGATLQRKFIKDQMNDIEDKARGELAWLKTVRTKDGYKAVPKDILYDLENAEAFASDEYALSWKYRTTRGPSAGKAILPYADMRVGDMILGVGKNSADGNDTFKVMKGELNDDQRKAVVKAIARTRAQNLIGGQRFQSTSDFRYDYALDYVLAFWEAQALGSNIQTYTKVIEFADMIAAIGGDVNLSVMPKDKGYKDGKLIFSNVTEINYEAALEANAKYDNAQLILVGINDEHIRLALEDNGETGGETIGFVIPYHASGASIEEFISALVSNLNEQFVKDNYVDYSDVQGDKARSNATEVQTRRRDLRKQILTGKHKAENDDGKTTSQSWTPTEADFELLIGESVDISNRSFEDLRAVEKKALAGDAEAIREYESWSAGVLKDLFNKLWDSNGSQYGVRLNSTQAASIMPHEYWNTNTTRANAYVNGFIFRSYCYSMGLHPRFTGMNSKGKKVDHGDFSDSTGYWKTLIDRPMYRNDGTYRDQQAVNMSNFQKGMLTKEWAETHWGEFKVKEPSVSKATKAADKLVAEVQSQPLTTNQKKKLTSSPTQDSVTRGGVSNDPQRIHTMHDTKQGKSQRTVREDNDNGRYPQDGGSDSSNETRTWDQLGKSAHKSIVKTVKEAVKGGGNTEEAMMFLAYLAGKSVGDMTQEDWNSVYYQESKSLYDHARQHVAIAENLHKYLTRDIGELATEILSIADRAKQRRSHSLSVSNDDWLDDGELDLPHYSSRVELTEEQTDFIASLRANTEIKALYENLVAEQNKLADRFNSSEYAGYEWDEFVDKFTGDTVNAEWNKDTPLGNLIASWAAFDWDVDIAYALDPNDTMSDRELRTRIDEITASEQAALDKFGNAVIDLYKADEAKRNPKTAELSSTQNMTEIDREYAKLRDSDKMLVRLIQMGVVDPNRPGVHKIGEELGQFLDLAGLTKTPRFSLSSIDSDGNTLTPSQIDFFKDSKIRDASGNLKPMFHGTASDFTVFDIGRAGRNWGGDSRLGKGFYFAESEYEAQQWTEGSRVVKAYLNITEPFDVDAPAPDNLIGEIDTYIARKVDAFDERNAWISKEQYIKNLQRIREMYIKDPSLFITEFKYDDNGNLTDGVRELLSALGYNGIVSKNETVAFYPEQIKLTTNTNPTDNPDIRYSLSDSSTDAEIAEAVTEKADAAVANAVIDSAPATPASIGSPAMTGEPVGVVIYERDTAADMAAAIERDPKLMALLEQYGVIPQTGKNYREAELPKRTAPKNKVSKTAVTVMGAEVTPESRLQTIDQAVVDNKLSYTPTTNQRDIQTAKRTIYRDGWDAAKGDWTAQVRAGKANSQLVAMGATLLQNMDGDEFTGQQYVDVLMDYAQLLRNAGQALQAAKILKKLTPAGKLYGMQRQVAKYNNEAGLNKTPPIEAWLDGAAEHLANRLSALTEIHIESDKAETEARKVVRILYDLAKETLPKNIRESDRAKAKERRDRLVMDRIQSIFDNKEEYTRVWNATKEQFVEHMGETPIDFTDFNRMMEDLSHYTTRLLADAKFSGLAIDEGLAAQFLSAKSDEDRDAIMEMIYADLGSKVKATGMEKFTAWRYLSMLGNFRTQVRNIFGNLFFQVPRMASVTMQGALEAMLQKAGIISERTTSALYDMDTFKFAFQDFENVREVILSGGKYQDASGDDLMQNIEKYRTIFKSKVLEGYRKITNTAMDAGDAAFCSFTYADSLARFMKANGTTWSAASEELREKARLRAIKDAAEATYRDNNSFAEFVSKIGRARDPHNPWEKTFATMIQGVLPFRKTPANILVRAIEYSPASFITGAVQAVRKAKGNEDISGTDIVRHFSHALTGSALVALGVWFASMGNLIGKAPDDDKERELWEMQGYQEYSLVVGNKSYTLDWLAPECIPLFLGANIHQAALEGGLTIGETLKALSSLTDPMLSMSMLQGINDALENATTYGDDAALTRFVGNALWGLLTQNVPTIFGQVERGFERNRMSTYIEAGAELPAVQRLIGKLSSKIPGWDSAQIIYTDAWGRTQDSLQSKTLNLIYQMFSPGYVSTIKTSPMEEELMRLYEATGESKVLISSAGKTITVDGKKINLTGDEYYSYSVQRGQTAYAIMTDLVNSTAYAEMDDAAKAKAVEKVYDYATQIAKYDITLEAYAADKWVLATRAAVAETGLPETAVVLYKCLLSAENEVNTSSVANKNIRNAIASDEALTVEQKNALDDLLISDGTYIPSDKKVDYASTETFIVTQMSDGAQTRWPQIKNQLHISADQYQAAWKIYHNDNLNAAEKKAELGTLIGSTQKGNLLYTLLGKKLEDK